MNQQNQAHGVSPAPLVKWKNAPTVRDLKQDLEDAQPIHSAHVSKVDTWLDNLNVTGKAKIPDNHPGSKIVPKLIRKQAEWRYASLSEPFLSTDDLFNVKPVTWEDRDAAKQNELVLNHQFNTKLDKQKFIDEYVRTAVDEGTVIVKTGWVYEEEKVKELKPVVTFRPNPALAPLHEQLAQMKQESPSQYLSEVPEELREAHDMTLQMGVPIEPAVTGQQEVEVTKVVKNHPTVEILSLKNVTLDPTANGDVDKAQFAVIAFESCLADLKKDGRYKNLESIQISNASILSQPDYRASMGMSGFNFKDEPRKKFWVHEYWGFKDIHGDGKLVPIVAAWVGETLIRLEENPFPDKKIPLVIEQYLPVRKSNYGEPDGALLEDNQKVIGAVTRGMIDILGKSANGQTGMRKDMLDAVNRRKFERGLDYEYNQGVDPRMGVHMHTYPEIPKSAQFMVQLQNMDAESLTGVKSFTQGVSGQSLGQVAAGVRGALDAASKRELAILRRLSNGILRIGRKMVAMNGEFLSDVEVIRITNDEFVRIRREDLIGEFDLRLSISTAEEDDNKARELAFMLQTMGNNMDFNISQMILSDIARLRKMPDLAKRIESFQPQPDPLEQRKRELEIALLEAQIANERAQAYQRGASGQLAQAKGQTEAVTASNIQSDTDLKNLQFVEQEAGVTQERELQKLNTQAANQSQIQREKGQVDLVKEYVKGRQQKKAA